MMGEDGLTYGEEQGFTEDYGYAAFMADVDTVLVGRKTYEVVRSFDMPFPHADKQVFVFSNTISGKDDYATYINEDIPAFVAQLKQTDGGTICVEGGGEIIRELRAHNLIDEYIISIIPVFIGEGIPLFMSVEMEMQPLQLVASQSYPSGLVQVRYSCN